MKYLIFFTVLITALQTIAMHDSPHENYFMLNAGNSDQFKNAQAAIHRGDVQTFTELAPHLSDQQRHALHPYAQSAIDSAPSNSACILRSVTLFTTGSLITASGALNILDDYIAEKIYKTCKEKCTHIGFSKNFCGRCEIVSQPVLNRSAASIGLGNIGAGAVLMAYSLKYAKNNWNSLHNAQQILAIIEEEQPSDNADNDELV